MQLLPDYAVVGLLVFYVTDYAVTRRITLKLYIPLYSKSLIPPLHISPRSSVGNALGLESKGRWFEPAVNHYFSPTMFACWYLCLYR